MKNEQFENDIKVVPGLFGGLVIVEADGESFLRGKLPVVDTSGKLWDAYQIEIKGSESYPLRFPKLYETGDAFPKNADWHVYENDESCCIDVPQNEIILCKSGLNVVEYIRSFTIPYFANQTFRIREGYYLYGEYSHGIFGKIEYYQSKLKASSPKQLVQMFDFIIRGLHLERTAFCPFCRKTKFRHCHRNVFAELSAIKRLMAIDGIEQLIPFFSVHPEYQLPKV
jgi:hypothetical protein